jgi:dipeptidyl aminopeptidase/acylaminoacyl peptidase
VRKFSERGGIPSRSCGLREILSRVHFRWTVFLLVFVHTSVTTAESSPITVRDSIGLTVLADPDPYKSGRTIQDVHWSPDKARFAVITRQGNLEQNCNRFRLLIFETAAVRNALARKQVATPTEVASFCSPTNRPGISHPKWLRGGRALAFLAEAIDRPAQVYEVDLETRTLRQISHHPSPVRDYDFNGGSRLIYAAEEPLDWTERERGGFAVGTESLIDIAGKGHFELWTRTAFYAAEVGDTSLVPVPTKVRENPYKIVDEPWGLWLSPRGTWAVALRYVDAPPPTWWTDYVGIASNPYWQGAADVETKDYTGPHPNIFLQFTLIDMASGASTSLLDAPCGLPFGGEGLSVIWSPDERSVILGNTFLPLTSTDLDELARRRLSPSIIELELKTHRIQRVADLVAEGQAQQGVRGTFQGISDFTAGRIIFSERDDQGATIYRTFVKSAGRWRESRAHARATSGDDLQVQIAQDVNTPPNLRARDVGHHREGLITDFNPQYRTWDTGHVETLHWEDAGGHAWTGGLLRPTHYRAGQRYPLVMQTHGYDPRLFLIDGPGGAQSGYAARVLANHQFMVLQVKDMLGPEGTREELDAQIAGYAAILDELDRQGLIERDRVGIHGWSRTGLYVQHALVFSNLKIAAASVSDASELSAYSSVLFFGLFFPGMVESERLIGAPLWGQPSAQLWAERDPSFHLDRLSAPLRIEANGQPYLGWDLYARLRRHHRPADFIFYPNGAHSLVRPAERWRSQQGTVDWYDFWLNGKENAEGPDSEQYVRWRALRAEANQRWQ